MRKFIILSLCIIFIFTLTIGSFASETSETLETLETSARTGRSGEVIDELGLISDTDLTIIRDCIEKSYSEYGYAVVIVYTRNLSDDQYTREAFTEKYFMENGYGSHGIMLYVGANSRTYDIYSAHKDGFSEISEYELDDIDAYVYTALRNDRFSEAARLFAEHSYMRIASGTTEQYYMDGKIKSDIFEIVGLSFFLAFIIALITVFIMKSKMKGIKPQRDAHGYIDRSTVRIYERQDRFLYSTVRKVRRDTSSSGGGSSGRSSSRSSGGSHRGGRF